MIRHLSYIACLVLAAPAFAAQPPPAVNPTCPYAGSTQTGTCTMAVLPTTPLSPATQPKFVNELPQPVFYDPEQVGSFDYYEIFSRQVDLSLAAPAAPFGAASITPATTATVDTYGSAVPAYNKAWLGLCNPAAKLTKTGTCPVGSELGTEVWGYGQLNMGGGLLGAVAGKPVSTYPGMSFRATKGKPVKVMWINQLPDQHLFCKFPLNSNYPCGIDRSIMGMQAGAMTAFGSSQQPDNAMVVHLHGGEIPPDSDGFAELWFGNAASAAAYRAPLAAAGDLQNIDPPLSFSPGFAHSILAASDPLLTGLWNGNSTPTGDTSKLGVQSAFAPVLGSLIRPTGDSMIYNYPMVQDAATIWYHDHALAKTRVNVAAGPAGYFYIQDPVVDTALWGATPDAATGYAFGNCTNTGIVSGLCRDVPIVLQDRSFNADGSINFPNGLGQAAKKTNPLTPGPNPTIHPQWVPEYFGDHAVVNGITWPKMTVGQAAYRFRFLDGSNARCYVLSLQSQGGKAGPAFNLIAGDQGYLPAPVASPTLTICPGERYEAVVDFSAFPAGTIFNLVNTAGAPFPNGITPQRSPTDRFLANMMQFVVAPAAGAVPAPAWTAPATWATAVANVNTRLAAFPHNPTTGALPAPLPANVSRRTFVLNEVLDPVTLAPLRVQIDGKAFEDPVSETPKQGSIEYWDIANTTVDAHPMHLHLVQFKVVGRWTVNMLAFQAAGGFTVDPLTGAITVNKAIDPMNFVIGAMRPPDPGEQGFKDTARSLPGEIVRIVAKWDAGWPTAFDPANPSTPFYQDVTSGPYVWHCHIVDHEDNEMMRPTLVVK